MKWPFLVTMCLLSFLLSCGSDNDDNEDEEREEEVNRETEGFYETKLIPLNTGLAGSTLGNFRIRIFGDEVRVRGEVQNSPRVFHRQFIHTGPDCPGPGADSNLDGILSFDESLRITGQALIPLDRNLSTQSSGYIFPVPGPLGNYTYSETTSLVRMVADLHADDPDPTDFITKLSPEEDLNLAGRTIVIYGIRGNSSLPIACGTLVRSVEPLPDTEVRPLPPTYRPPVPVPVPVPLPPRVPWDDSFSTIISTDLMISGTKCSGGERTDDNYICYRNQWLVTVNNSTFIANLILVRNISNNQTAYYNIRPMTPVDNQTLREAREHWVKFNRGSAPVVLRKPER